MWVASAGLPASAVGAPGAVPLSPLVDGQVVTAEHLAGPVNWDAFRAPDGAFSVPDLQLSDISLDPPEHWQGTRPNISATVRNSGTAAPGPFYVSYQIEDRHGVHLGPGPFEVRGGSGSWPRWARVGNLRPG